MKYLDYYFFKQYELIMMTGERSTPQINTFLGIVLYLVFNILTLMLLSGYIPDKSRIVLMVFSLTFISWFIFIRKRRYLSIYERFKSNDPYPIGGRILVIVYDAVSFAGAILAAVAVRNGWI